MKSENYKCLPSLLSSIKIHHQRTNGGLVDSFIVCKGYLILTLFLQILTSNLQYQKNKTSFFCELYQTHQLTPSQDRRCLQGRGGGWAPCPDSNFCEIEMMRGIENILNLCPPPNFFNLPSSMNLQQMSNCKLCNATLSSKLNLAPIYI